MTITQLRKHIEQLAAKSVIRAQGWIGVDREMDAFEQGKTQAYRDAVKLIAGLALKNAPC